LHRPYIAISVGKMHLIISGVNGLFFGSLVCPFDFFPLPIVADVI
jgi:hypothetical protein